MKKILSLILLIIFYMSYVIRASILEDDSLGETRKKLSLTPGLDVLRAEQKKRPDNSIFKPHNFSPLKTVIKKRTSPLKFQDNSNGIDFRYSFGVNRTPLRR